MNDLKRRIELTREAIAKLQTLEGELRLLEYEKAGELQLYCLELESWVRRWQQELDEIQV